MEKYVAETTGSKPHFPAAFVLTNDSGETLVTFEFVVDLPDGHHPNRDSPKVGIKVSEYGEGNTIVGVVEKEEVGHLSPSDAKHVQKAVGKADDVHYHVADPESTFTTTCDNERCDDHHDDFLVGETEMIKDYLADASFGKSGFF